MPRFRTRTGCVAFVFPAQLSCATYSCIQQWRTGLPIGSEFENNRTQAVHVRDKGTDRIRLPAGHAWDSFFLEGSGVSKDFLAKRPEQQQPDREPL